MNVQSLVDFLVVFATDFLLPIMGIVFFLGVTARVLIWWTVKREYWFAAELEKRIQRYINSVENTNDISFFVVSKRLLEITFYELFEVRSIMKRRNPDVVMNWVDRIFLVQQGCARTVNDILRKIRYYRFDNETPKFLDLSKNVLQNNPCFNRIFGIIPMSGLNDILNILPNLFIVGGIFGTFLGIMKALPELGGMDLTDAENSKMIMDTFLLKISFSMSTSIMGIVLSVSMTFVNTFLSADKQFVMTVEHLTESLSTLWSISSHNKLPVGNQHLDESDDPLLVLAEDVVSRELNVQPGFVKLTKPIQGWWIRSRSEELTKKESVSRQDHPEEREIQPKTTEPKQSAPTSDVPETKNDGGFIPSDIKEDYVTREQRNPRPQPIDVEDVTESIAVENGQEQPIKTLQNEEEEVDKDEVA